MRAYLKTLSARKPVVYTGDLNVGHLDLDIHNPHAKHIVKQSGLTPVERAAFQQMLDECGYQDAFRHLYPGNKRGGGKSAMFVFMRMSVISCGWNLCGCAGR
jgi:exonuclease III